MPRERVPYMTPGGRLYWSQHNSFDYAIWRAQKARTNAETAYFLDAIPLPTLSPTGGPLTYLAPPSERPGWVLHQAYPEIPLELVGELCSEVLVEPDFPLDEGSSWGDPNPGGGPSIAYVGQAPDSTVCIEMRHYEGAEDVFVSAYVPLVADPGARHVSLQFQVWIEDGFDFGVVGTDGKIGGGLWGGDQQSTGGYPPWLQQGITVRNVWGSDVAGIETRSYSYMLNRDQTSRDEYVGGLSMFGSKPGKVYGALTTGQWMTFEYEGLMNTPGYADGLCRFWIDGTFIGEATDCIWAIDDEWLWRGAIVAHAWQQEPCPKDQKYWVRNLTLYLPE
jgi:hypothetical protein